MTITIEDIARVVHAANREIQRLNGELVGADWDDSSTDSGISHRESSIAAVTLLLEHPEATGRDQHERWRAERIAQGWTFGPTKDFTRKTSPFLIAYEELPYVQRAKDIVRAGIVGALRPLLTGSSSGTIPMRECEHSGCSREFPDTWPWRFCPEHEPVLQIDGTTTTGNGLVEDLMRPAWVKRRREP